MIVSERDGVQVVALGGRIDAATAPALESLLNGMLDDGRHRIVCDFAANEYVSSVGLRVFLSALKRTTKAGGRLALCSLRPGIREIFDMTGFSGLFPIFDGEEAALASFRPGPPAADGGKNTEIAGVAIGRRPEEVTRAYVAEQQRGRMDEKV